MTWTQLNQSIVECGRCPRLRRHCRKIAAVRRAAFANQTYWGKPVPNWAPSDPSSPKLLIVGLAPAAHGGNRTGRVFTGDRSGDFLFRAMYETGFSSQSASTSTDDGLELIDCAITAICHCAPPDNKPTPREIRSCQPFLDQTLALLPNVKVVLALGKLAFDASAGLLERAGWHPTTAKPKPKFAHGAGYEFLRAFDPTSNNPVTLLATYHPSQQNTFTGRLTPDMLRAVFARAAALIRPADGRRQPHPK